MPHWWPSGRCESLDGGRGSPGEGGGQARARGERRGGVVCSHGRSPADLLTDPRGALTAGSRASTPVSGSDPLAGPPGPEGDGSGEQLFHLHVPATCPRPWPDTCWPSPEGSKGQPWALLRASTSLHCGAGWAVWNPASGHRRSLRSPLSLPIIWAQVRFVSDDLELRSRSRSAPLQRVRKAVPRPGRRPGPVGGAALRRHHRDRVTDGSAGGSGMPCLPCLRPWRLSMREPVSHGPRAPRGRVGASLCPGTAPGG